MLRVVASIADVLRVAIASSSICSSGQGANIGLFETGIDPMVVIRWKDIFERLENAIDSTQRAAFILEGIVIKHA